MDNQLNSNININWQVCVECYHTCLFSTFEWDTLFNNSTFVELNRQFGELSHLSLLVMLGKLQLYNEDWNEKVIGAIQYEGSNDFSNKPLHIVCWRFYRNNLPSIIKDQLENINEFRRDTNKGPNVDPTAQSITFKFQGEDNGEYDVINRIAGILSS